MQVIIPAVRFLKARVKNLDSSRAVHSVHLTATIGDTEARSDDFSNIEHSIATIKAPLKVILGIAAAGMTIAIIAIIVVVKQKA